MDERAAERRAEAHAHYAAGVIHEMNNEQQAASDEYYQAAMLDPDDETLILDVSRRLLQAKQPERALEIVTRAAAQPDASGEIDARLGLIYSQLGKPDQAVAANRAAIRKSPESLTGYQNLFLNYVRNKQPSEALKVLDEAAGQANPDAEFLIGLADLYTTFGTQVPAQKESSNAKALAALNRAAKLGPDSPLLRLKLADGFNLLGEPAKAALLYLEVLKQPPDLPMVQERVRANLATIYLRGSDHQRAVEQLKAILRDDPTNPQVYYYLGRLALEDKNPAEAVDHFSKTLLLSPDLESGYYFLALAQIEVDKAHGGPGHPRQGAAEVRAELRFGILHRAGLQPAEGVRGSPSALRRRRDHCPGDRPATPAAKASISNWAPPASARAIMPRPRSTSRSASSSRPTSPMR